MTDVILVQPPVRDFYITAKRTIPYGLAGIAASLKANGFSVDILDGLATSKSRIIDLPEEMAYLADFYGRADFSPFSLFHEFRHFGYSFEHLGKKAKESDAFLIGISSLFTAYSKEALQTAEVIKAWHPSCKIVLGGHHPTAMPEHVMQCPSVDYVIRGDGEVSLSALSACLKEKFEPADEILSEIQGLVFRKTDGYLHVSEPVWMRNPDDYPLPETSLIRSNYYQRWKQASSVIVTSRGCPMACTYCSLGKNSQTPYRRRSLEAVLQEMDKAVSGDKAGFIDFEDENLSFERNWFMTLLSEIKTRFKGSSPELRAMNGMFPASLDKEMICSMKEAGFKTINLSLGTISEKQLKRFNRRDMKAEFEKALGYAEEYGINAVSYIIVGAPFQDPIDSVEDLLYLARLRTLAGVSVFYPSPGSYDFSLAGKLGLLPDHLSLMRSSAVPISHTTSRLESVTLIRLGRLLNFMKSMKDQGKEIKNRISEYAADKLTLDQRWETGIDLVHMFLSDGKIRGVSRDGTIFIHDTALNLTRRFRNGISHGLRGAII